MWIIYVILGFLLLSIIAKVQEYNSQKKEKEERENRIRKNLQTGAFDYKKEIFYNLYIINTGGHCYDRAALNFIVEGGKTGFSDKEGKIIVAQKFDAVRVFKGHYAVTVIDGKYGLSIIMSKEQNLLHVYMSIVRKIKIPFICGGKIIFLHLATILNVN